MEVPRGMRDFLPAEAGLRKEIIARIERVYVSYGFQPVAVPALEYLSTLRAKCGEEVSGQLYEIEDMGLRFDLTVGLARMVSNRSLPKPFKAYNIAQVWRRDEPQYGRYREFWQADCDIIGADTPESDAEIIACIADALKEIGIEKFLIRINNRITLSDIIKNAGIDEKNITATIRALDKLDKKGETEVKKELLQQLERKQVSALFKLLKSKRAFAGSDRIDAVVRLLKEYGIKNVKVDLSLARGLGYYTGMIFEVMTDKKLGMIAGGGRYDGLLGVYGAPAPAVGGSIGIDRVAELMQGKLTIPSRGREIYIATIGDVSRYAAGVVKKLREAGIIVSLNLTNRPLKKQLSYANSLNFPFVGIIGEKEQGKRAITLRNMKTGEEQMLSVEKVIDTLSD